MGHVAHEARVVEQLQQRGLAVEAVEDLGRGRAVQQLEGHGLAAGVVQGAVDEAHAATSRQVFEPETSGDEGIPGERPGGGGGRKGPVTVLWFVAIHG